VVVLSRYFRGLGITALCTAIAYPVYPSFDAVNIVMVYLLGAAVAGLWLGRGPAALAAVANTAAFDFFFVPPRYTFYVAETQYLFTMGVMPGVAFVIANLMISVRSQTESAAERERRTATLYAMSRELAVAADSATIADVAARHMSAALEGAADIQNLVPEQTALVEALAGQVALALERVRLAELAAASRAAAERAALRNTLLASISHDLRGPLSAIAGAGSLVAQSSDSLDRHRRQTLGHLIEEKARDMSGLFTNILELMRLETAGPASHEVENIP
jgi:two-component system sensor histidine kinase KdpD